MAENVNVSHDSKQRVAFDLMMHISNATYEESQDKQKTKDYWLKLYRQCYKAVNGNSQRSILEED